MVNKYYERIIDENRYMWINLMNNQNIMLEISLRYKKSRKIEIKNEYVLMNVANNFCDVALSTKGILFI